MTLTSKLKSFRTRYFSPCMKAKDNALMKQKLLNPLSFYPPYYEEAIHEDFKPHWVIGIDPDLFGALAVLKFDDTESCSAQVYDTPRSQSCYDAKSMVELIRTLNVPSGTKAFIAESIPYSREDDAMDAYEGLGYGLWIGILLTSHISVTSVVPSTWKKHFRLSLWSLDAGMKLALEMFPSLRSQLAMRSDRARANALLIAAYGQATSVTKYYSFSQI